MATTILQSERTFQTWHYHVTHSQLLIRSPHNKANERNIDLIFYGVEYMNTPTMFSGLEIEQVESNALRHLAELSGIEVREGWTYRLITEEKEFFIVCAHFRQEENDLQFMESPLKTVGGGLSLG